MARLAEKYFGRGLGSVDKGKMLMLLAKMTESRLFPAFCCAIVFLVALF